MNLPGACFIGTTLSQRPGQRWVVAAWSEDGERCVLAALPPEPNTPLSNAKGEESRVVRASVLERAVDRGVLVVAGGLGAAAVSLVVGGLVDDTATPEAVRTLLSRRRR